MQHVLSFYYPNSTVNAQNDGFSEEIFSDGKTFRCNVSSCGKTFRFRSEAMRHKLIHIPKRPFRCPVPSCEKSFKREDALKSHIRLHTGDRPHKCEEPGCGREFSNKSGLRYHMLKHKGDKEHMCSACTKKFLTKAQLRQHEGTHTTHSWKQKMLLAQTSSVKEAEEYDDVSRNKMRKWEDTTDESVGNEMDFGNDLKWGNTYQMGNVQEGMVDEGLQGDFEKTVKAILKENTAMKEMLNMWHKMKGMMLENKSLGDKLGTMFDVREQKHGVPQEGSDQQIFAFLKFDEQDRFY